MRLVVADTSPRNYLVLIEQVEILPTLFEKVFVPQIVRDELRHDEAPESVRRWIAEPPSWVEIVPAAREIDDPALLHLDDGRRPSHCADQRACGVGLNRLWHNMPWPLDTLFSNGTLERTPDVDKKCRADETPRKAH